MRTVKLYLNRSEWVSTQGKFTVVAVLAQANHLFEYPVEMVVGHRSSYGKAVKLWEAEKPQYQKLVEPGQALFFRIYTPGGTPLRDTLKLAQEEWYVRMCVGLVDLINQPISV